MVVLQRRAPGVVTGRIGGMSHFLEEPDTGPDTPAETSKRRTRGVDPLSTSHRRRLLAALNRAAENGDVAAQQALVELSISAELDKAIAAAIEQAKGEGEG
jgi:hypothetical protein